MKLKNMVISAATLFITAVTLLTTGVFAASFKDLPETHWAYVAVDSVSDRGYISGDAGGLFKPNDFVDKFTFSVILAKAAGYTGGGAAYDNIHQDYKDYIERFVARYAGWNTNVSREIAYLLYKGIYTKEDLLAFYRSDGGTDKLAALTKEQTCVFLVRLIGQQAEALNAALPEPFNDDSRFSPAYKPYVYYMRSLGFVRGDTDGNFNPKDAASKAVMAVMLNNVLPFIPPVQSDEITSVGAEEPAADVPDESYVSIIPNADVNGVITGFIFDVLGDPKITVTDSSGTSHEFIVTKTSSLTRNSITASFDDLLINDAVELTAENNTVLRLNVLGTGAPIAPTNAEAGDLYSAEGTVYSAGSAMFTIYSGGDYQTFRYGPDTVIIGLDKGAPLSVGMKLNIDYTKSRYARTVTVIRG